MRLHRFYINEKVGEKTEITLTDLELIHQLQNVFRFKAHDKVILFDGSGFEFEAEIVLINKKNVSVKILMRKSPLGRPQDEAASVSLYLSLIKKSNFELAAEKCTEVGVSEIHPIISERSEKKDLNLERLNKIVKEASEQSGRVTLPTVFDIVDLQTAVSQVVKGRKVGVVFHTVSDTHHLPPSTQDSSLEKAEKREAAVFVGPEGGWTDSEMELFKKNNFKILSLGTNILRAETAAIVAVWKILNN